MQSIIKKTTTFILIAKIWFICLESVFGLPLSLKCEGDFFKPHVRSGLVRLADKSRPGINPKTDPVLDHRFFFITFTGSNSVN